MAEKLTEMQRATLAALAQTTRRATTNVVSSWAGHGYGPWAATKLAALEKRGLVRRWLRDRVSETSWEITDAGRSALAQEKGERA